MHQECNKVGQGALIVNTGTACDSRGVPYHLASALSLRASITFTNMRLPCFISLRLQYSSKPAATGSLVSTHGHRNTHRDGDTMIDGFDPIAADLHVKAGLLELTDAGQTTRQ